MAGNQTAFNGGDQQGIQIQSLERGFKLYFAPISKVE
jgi:hypothetical protein